MPPDIIVSVINGLFLVLVALLGTDIWRKAKDNASRLVVIERQTNGELEHKIRRAVAHELEERYGAVYGHNELRELLDAILLGVREGADNG